MKVEYSPSFEKDIVKCKNKKILLKLKETLIVVENAETMRDVSNIKKVIGGENAYRVKISEYRAAFYYINNIVLFTRFLHRKDIYKYFPQ